MPEPHARAGFFRRYFPMAAKAVVSVALLGALFYFYKIDVASLWAGAKSASIVWLLVALAIYFVNVMASTWRWHILLEAQRIHVRGKTLLASFLVAGFFNNFLPSNIGGDFVRIRDSAQAAGSKTLATTVILVDRVLGLMGLVLISAVGASLGASGQSASPIWPPLLWAGFFAAAAVTAPAVVSPTGFARLLRPLMVLHPEWVGGRIQTLTSALRRFRERPGALAACFTGAVVVQALMVVYYVAVAYALHIPIGASDLAVIVPLSFVVQMLPVSMNGFGVREATFSFYFTRIGFPNPGHSAVLLSLMATALIMVFSLSGAAVYASRGR